MSYQLPGPKSEAILKTGDRYFRNGANFQKRINAAKMAGLTTKPPQCLFAKAQGDFLWDLDGNKYIDFQNGWASNPLGNANPEIIEAATGAMKQFGFCYEHPLRYELAEQITAISPNGAHTRVNYEVSGAEAAEAAVHLALCAKKARFIINFDYCFHGASFGTRTFSAGAENSRYIEAWKGGAIQVPYPITYQTPAGMSLDQYIDYILWYIEDRIPYQVAPADTIAGIIVEPGSAEGGNWIPTAKFMQGLKRICEKYEWILIADEVLTGLGRTGKLWGVDHFGITPDITCIGKNITGGIEPIAMVTATEEVMADNTSSQSGSTYAGSPAGCAAALKTLEIYKRDNVVENARAMGEIARERMKDWAQKYSIVGEVRSLGLLMCANIVDPATGEPSTNWGMSVGDEALRRGAFVVNDHENTVRLYPSLVIEEKTLLDGLDIVEAAIAHVDKNGPKGRSDAVFYPYYYTGFTGN